MYPGLGGEAVSSGGMAIYDGSEWQATSNIPYATTTPGVVRLSTHQDVNLTNTLSVLTPASGLYPIQQEVIQAATDVVGITRYATKTEADAGAETEAALTPASIADILARLAEVETKGSVLSTGIVQWFAGVEAAIPDGWLYCNGQTIVNEPGKENLYALLVNSGNPYSDNVNAVKVLDLRGVFIRGFDERLAINGGRNPDDTAFGQFQDEAFRAHTHIVNDPGHNHVVTGYRHSEQDIRPDAVIVDDSQPATELTDSNAINTAMTGITINQNGGTETRPKNVNMIPIIKL